MTKILAFCGIAGFSVASILSAAEPAKEAADSKPPVEEAVEAGHSYHGEVFNEGPRQRAYLMQGTGHVDFPVTTDSEEAQKFVSQGLGQLYGFWYLEAERSFRQAAAIDPECAMAYWGAAMANSRNSKRAKGFMKEAMKYKDKATDREQMYIEAFNKYINGDSKKRKENAETYTRDLEKLLYKYPDDIEAKALLALQLYSNRSAGSKITSYLAVDALLGEVFDKQPLHSAHHFRIHLWDSERAEKALESAAKCGGSSPAIAHMWHMPGHIYSRLKRYNEGAWQQEASARVDHAHMMRDRVLPDQIHNFAHNNEWLIRNLMFVGRARDAVSLAKNMLELPRHPKYNSYSRGSANYGRRRLPEVLRRYELWEQAVALTNSAYLEKGPTMKLTVDRLTLLGSAHFCLAQQATNEGNAEQASEHAKAGEAVLSEVVTLLQEKQTKRDEAGNQARRKYYRDKAKQWAVDDAKGKHLPPWETEPTKLTAAQVKARDKAVADARRRYDADVRELERTERTIKGWKLFSQGEFSEAYEILKKAGGVDTHLLTRVQFQVKDQQQKAIDAIKAYVGSHENEVLPLATYVELLWRDGKKDEAKKQFEKLQSVAAKLDLDTPVARRLAPIAMDLGLATKDNTDWREPFQFGDDFGDRPSLDSLGPFRWQPSPAPAWTLSQADEKTLSLADFQGKPVVVIFYLGYGCLHCAEQLQKFSPMAEKFRDEGIELVAISTDDLQGLKRSIDDFKPGKLQIPLVADPELNVFKQYRVYDDFENLALHGTFLIDAQGDVRWQDIHYEPFMDAEFLLKEAPRLLKLDAPPSEGEPSQVAAAAK